MSEKLTRIRLPRVQAGRGLLEWGEKTRSEMIAIYRKNAQCDFDAASKILHARDSDFEIDVVRGSIVQHFIRKALP